MRPRIPVRRGVLAAAVLAVTVGVFAVIQLSVSDERASVEPQDCSDDFRVEGTPPPDNFGVLILTYSCGGVTDLLRVRGAGAESLRLTTDSARWVSAPAWSPEGSRYAYVSARASPRRSADLVVVDVLGGTETRIASFDKTDANYITKLAWSPDGQHIGFTLGGYSDIGEATIMRIDPEGAGLIRLTRTGRYDDFDWSPDGRQIAFIAWDETLNRHLWLMDADGGNPRQLTHSPNPNVVRWSPDGTALAYSNGWVRVLTLPDGPERLLSAGDNPVWSPDGKRVALVRQSNTYLAERDGTGELEIVADPGFRHRGHAWSPDGSFLSYVSSRPESCNGSNCVWFSELHVVSADGRERWRIVPTAGSFGTTAWQPKPPQGR